MTSIRVVSRTILCLVAVYLFASSVSYGQCAKVVYNPLTGRLDCSAEPGAQGPAGPAGPAGPINTIANGGVALPVQATVNFPTGMCGDNAVSSRTDCTPEAPLTFSGPLNRATNAISLTLRTGGGLSNLSNELSLQNCTTGQILKFTSPNWGCAVDAGENPLTFSAPLSRLADTISLTLHATGGIETSGSALSLLRSCLDNQILKYTTAGGWACATDNTGAGGGVDTFEGRSGTVVSANGDYTASEVTNVPAGGIAAITVQAAVNELDGEKAASVHTHGGGDITSAVASATALAANGTNCAAGQAPLGVDASGNSEGCFTPGGALAVENNGVAVGSEATHNYLPGTGILTTLSDAGLKITIQNAIDTAVVMTRANAQSGADWKCTGSGTAGAQTCTMSPALGAYTSGMVIQYTPGTTNVTTQTLNAGGGVASILKHDGSALSAGDVTSTRQYAIWYDGTAFRLPPTSTGGGAPVPSVDTYANRGTCNAGATGKVHYPTDSFYTQLVCDGTNWRHFAGPGQEADVSGWPVWAWGNMSTSSVSTVKGGETLTAPNGTAGDITYRCETGLTSPFTRSALLRGIARPANWSVHAAFGIGDSTGKTVTLQKITSSGGGMNVMVYSSGFLVVSTLFSGNSTNAGGGVREAYHMQVEVDATNIYLRLGDGIGNWTTVHSEAKTTNLGTIDRVCWGANPSGSGANNYVTLLSYQ